MLSTSAPVDLRVDTANIQPKASTQSLVVANLDSRVSNLLPASFNALDPSTYHNSTTVQEFDSLGNPHNLTMFFLKSANNTWQVFAQNDGVAVSGSPVGTINFTTGGSINTATTTLPFNLSLTMSGGAVTPQPLALNFNNSTQFGSNFGVTQITQDGYTAGRLLGFNISPNGMVQGRYSNGQSKPQGQIVIASFSNPQGLQPLGNNAWGESSASGQPLVGAPNSGALGVLQAGALEESNVDLTAELVNMITAQRVYQANAQTIKTQDSLLQTLVTLR